MATTIGKPTQGMVYHPEVFRAYAESRILLVKRETELVMEMLRQSPVATSVASQTEYPTSPVESELQRVRTDIAEIDRQFRFKDDAKPTTPPE